MDEHCYRVKRQSLIFIYKLLDKLDYSALSNDISIDQVSQLQAQNRQLILKVGDAMSAAFAGEYFDLLKSKDELLKVTTKLVRERLTPPIVYYGKGKSLSPRPKALRLLKLIMKIIRGKYAR